MTKPDRLRDSWASLGVAFHNSGEILYSPEEAIMLLVQSNEFPEDKKILGLALTWLEMHSRLVHVERLQNMLHNCTIGQLAFLGAIARKCLGFGDHRWKKIEALGLRASKRSGFLFSSDDELLLKMKGTDSDFERFKIFVTPVILESEKKFVVWEDVLKLNPWLRLRLLFGTNLRADVATVIYLQLATTAYAAAKYLQCSMSAVYKNWDELHQANWPAISK